MLSRYRILEKLGAGGMGVVYRAEDISLRRPVALKFLGGTSVSQEQKRARFLREARAAAALNHPAICTIHEVGEVEPGEEQTLGVGERIDAGTPFIAMELIEGRTLREAIGGRSLPVSEALRLAVEIAEGLSAAHQAKVIHRDLKPDNVIVTPGGHAKILDFGLAKLLEEPAAIGADETSKLATFSNEITQLGSVIGTAAYMSPEQARGLAVDTRSDLFSFGIVLYEMATGKAPFWKSTAMDTMAAILREPAVPAARLNPEVPAELERIIGKCLEKDPAVRYQDCRDLVVDLGKIKRDSESRPLMRAEASAPAVAPRRNRLGARWAGVIAAAVVGLAGLAGGAWSLLRHGSAEVNTALPFRSMEIRRLASIKNLAGAALSSDGKFLAYVTFADGNSSLSLRQISTGGDVTILPPQNTEIWGLAFAPDGDNLYYLAEDPGTHGLRDLYQIPTLGGAPRKVLSDVDSSPALSPDEKTIAFVRNDPVLRRCVVVLAQSDGTAERNLAVKNYPRGFGVEGTTIAWSPDGRRIAALANVSEGGGYVEIVEIGVSDGKESRVGSSRWSRVRGLAWLGDGSGLVLTGAATGDSKEQVWFVSSKDGKASRITNDVSHYSDIGVSADSRTLVAVRTEVAAMDLWVAPGNDPAAAKQVASGGASAEFPKQVGGAGGTTPISIAGTPSGEIVFEDVAHVLWVVAPDGAGRRRLTPDGMECSAPLVARETGRVVFTARREDRVNHVWTMDPDRETPVQMTRGAGESAKAISPDGRTFVFERAGEDDLWRMRLDGAAEARIEVASRSAMLPVYAPDGKFLWISRFSQEAVSPRRGLTRIPADGGPATEWLEWPRECDEYSRWAFTPSADAIACIGMVNGLRNIWTRPLAASEARPFTRFESGHVFDFDWSTDGKRLLMLRGELATDVVLITGFK